MEPDQIVPSANLPQFLTHLIFRRVHGEEVSELTEDYKILGLAVLGFHGLDVVKECPYIVQNSNLLFRVLLSLKHHSHLSNYARDYNYVYSPHAYQLRHLLALSCKLFCSANVFTSGKGLADALTVVV